MSGQHVVIDGVEYVDPAVARERAKEKFISLRTVGEQQFNTWKNGWMKCPANVRLQASYDFTESTFRSEVPEYYVDVPNPEVCKQQLDVLNGRIMEINNLIDALNREGLERLAKYNAM